MNDEEDRSTLNQDLKYDIEIFNLSKDYRLKNNKIVHALRDVNLKVKKGEILGLLGPNGAGKTTLVSILSTLARPTSGTAKILGYDIIKQIHSVKMSIGLMFGPEMIYHRLTGYRNLKYYSRLYGISNYKERIKELAEKFNLADWMDQYVDKYSRGMQLKLALARILLIKPKVLFMDEPLLGLDPKSVLDLIEILKNFNQTIVLTSHQMNIVEKLCDRIAFLKEGEIIKVDTQTNYKDYLLKEITYKIEIINKKSELFKEFQDLSFIHNIINEKDYITFNIKDRASLPSIFNILKDYPVRGFNEIQPNLEELFLKFA